MGHLIWDVECIVCSWFCFVGLEKSNNGLNERVMDSFKELLVNKLDFKESELLHLDLEMDVINLKKKDYLIKAGSICSFVGFIESGVLRSYIKKDNYEHNVDFFLSGSFVSSYTSFLLQEPAKTSIQALSNSIVYILSYSSYNKLLKANMEWYKLAKFIADSLFLKKCRREKSLLMDSAEDRYKLLIKAYPQIEQLVAQYHIASYLGIKPESLSRMKSLTYINK